MEGQLELLDLAFLAIGLICLLALLYYFWRGEMKLPRLDPTPGQILQALHCFISFSIVMGAILFFGATALVGFYCVIVWAVVKDLIWDMTFETTTWWEELKDAFVYLLAGAVMFAFCYYREVGR